MSTYRKEWNCCGSVTETEAWEPDTCPFCSDSQTIRTQQAEIERLKGKRDRLLEMLKNMKSELSQFNWRGDLQEEITSIIAEIEAEK